MSATQETPSKNLTMAERYQNLSTAQVMKYIGAESRQTVWDYVKTEKLPKPKYIAAHRPVWQLGELVDHLDKVLEPYESGISGFKGKPETQSNNTQKIKLSAARKLRERFGFGK